MLILGIDTATLSCSVALLQDDTLLAEMTLNINKTHSERLLPLIDTMLTEAGFEREQIRAIAVSAGPGSFTGLRIGIATARGLARGLDIPAISVPTLEAMAENLITPGALICPILDARRRQVYAAIYRRSVNEPYCLETVLKPQALSFGELGEVIRSGQEKVTFCGEGLNSYRQAVEEELSQFAYCAPTSARLCRAALVALYARPRLEKDLNRPYKKLFPQYLRRPEAEVKAEEQGK